MLRFFEKFIGRRRDSRQRFAVRSCVGEQLENRLMFAAIEMTDQEQLLLELVNRARANPAGEAALFNMGLNDDLEPDEISTDAKQPLAPHQALIYAARLHADNMLNFDFFAHEDPQGNDPSDRARAAGYPSGAGENIAWFGDLRLIDEDQQVYERHQALFESPPHRTNMMNAGYRELGNGIRFGNFEGRQSIMVAESFGNRGGNNLITGVAYSDRVVANRFYEIGEGIGAMEIEATRHLDGTKYTTTTGPSGGYGLQVPPGVYTLTGTKGATSIVVNHVFVNGINEKVDFNTRESGLGIIEGRVFNDKNRDGKLAANEGFVSDTTIYIDALDNGRLDTHELQIKTDSSGRFRFSGLQAGTYQVRLFSTSSQSVSTPDGEMFEIELQIGETVDSLLFGIAAPNNPPTVQSDVAETISGASVIIDVLANDSDSESDLDRQSLRIAFQPPNGRAQVDEFSGTVTYVPNSNFEGPDAFLYTVDDLEGTRSANGRVDIMVRAGVGTIWQNQEDRFDVNDDQNLSSIDVLQIANSINLVGSRTLTFRESAPPPFIDVTGDGVVSALDALQVTNEINRLLAELSGEGENPDDGASDFAPRFAVAAVQSTVDEMTSPPVIASDEESSSTNPGSHTSFDLALVAMYGAEFQATTLPNIATEPNKSTRDATGVHRSAVSPTSSLEQNANSNSRRRSSRIDLS